ncbi:MAG: hypothetical protein LBQ22_02155 [Bacteroidales bacterium]|nr:hypothetical protein [Bacteroidales bacterium]
MKTYLFIFLLLSPLWVFSSCQDDEDKLPGSKPEILLGKWRAEYEASFMFGQVRHLIETYEFTSGGGSIKTVEYFPDEDCYEDDLTIHFTDWSYRENEIYFLKKKAEIQINGVKPFLN